MKYECACPHGLAGASRQFLTKKNYAVKQYSYDTADAGAHHSLFKEVEGFLYLFYDGVRNGHAVGTAAVEGVGLQAVTIFRVPHFGHNANRVALNVLAHEGGVVQVNAVAVVLREAQGVGVVFGDHHFPGLAASQRDSGSYHNNY